MTNLEKVYEMCRRVDLSKSVGRHIYLKALTFGLRRSIPQEVMMVDVAWAIKYAADNREHLINKTNRYRFGSP